MCGGIIRREGGMSGAKQDLTRLREILHSALVEVEVAIDTATHPDWSETKESLLRAIEIVRKMERDSVWTKLSKK
jgi:collagenase-like PrtC family protease